MDLICCPPVDVVQKSYLAVAKCPAKNRLNSFQTVSFGSHKASWFWGIFFYFYKRRYISPFGILMSLGQKKLHRVRVLFLQASVLALGFSLKAKFIHTLPCRGAQLSNLWWMPNSVTKGFDTAMKVGSSRWFKRYPTTYIWVLSWLSISFTVD